MTTPIPDLASLVKACLLSDGFETALDLAKHLHQQGLIHAGVPLAAEQGLSLTQAVVAQKIGGSHSSFYKDRVAERLLQMDPAAFSFKVNTQWWAWQVFHERMTEEERYRYGFTSYQGKPSDKDAWMARIIPHLPDEAFQDEGAERVWRKLCEFDAWLSLRAMVQRRPDLWRTRDRMGALAIRQAGAWAWSWLRQDLSADARQENQDGIPLWRELMTKTIGPRSAPGTLRGTVELWLEDEAHHGRADEPMKAVLRQQRAKQFGALLADKNASAKEVAAFLRPEELRAITKGVPVWWLPLQRKKEGWLDALQKQPWHDQLGPAWILVRWLDGQRQKRQPDAVPEDVMAKVPAEEWDRVVEHLGTWLGPCLGYVREVLVPQAHLHDVLPSVADTAPRRKVRL